MFWQRGGGGGCSSENVVVSIFCEKDRTSVIFWCRKKRSTAFFSSKNLVQKGMSAIRQVPDIKSLLKLKELKFGYR
jgi:hypothetical protein